MPTFAAVKFCAEADAAITMQAAVANIALMLFIGDSLFWYSYYAKLLFICRKIAF